MYDKPPEILDEIDELEAEQREYRELARIWADMWSLTPPFTEKDSRKAVENEGREQITLPTPRNVVHLVQRLVATEPKIDDFQQNEVEGDDTSGRSCASAGCLRSGSAWAASSAESCWPRRSGCWPCADAACLTCAGCAPCCPNPMPL